MSNIFSFFLISLLFYITLLPFFISKKITAALIKKDKPIYLTYLLSIVSSIPAIFYVFIMMFSFMNQNVGTSMFVGFASIVFPIAAIILSAINKMILNKIQYDKYLFF